MLNSATGEAGVLLFAGINTSTTGLQGRVEADVLKCWSGISAAALLEAYTGCGSVLTCVGGVET